ncbi:hypothetical protein AB0F59_00765 [Micromonospora lupini]|uniref:hypothetical protein n=1 Tax=Micromonospora lupini TaxID=285679 RepID=UPI003410CB45
MAHQWPDPRSAPGAAMTPRHYVLRAQAPADPADLSGWQRQPVLAKGAGREITAVPGGEPVRRMVESTVDQIN